MTADPHDVQADLVERLYGELRKLAAAKLRRESPGLTLEATALVHEAVLRLERQTARGEWQSPAHFFAAAAEAMRRLLVEQARRRRRLKRGSGRARLSLSAAEPLAPSADATGQSDDVEAVSRALVRLEALDPDRAQVVKLRYFAGLKMPEIAQALGVSLATVERRWAYARAWLFREIAGGPGDGPGPT